MFLYGNFQFQPDILRWPDQVFFDSLSITFYTLLVGVLSILKLQKQ